jgi:hypothetical protein
MIAFASRAFSEPASALATFRIHSVAGSALPPARESGRAGVRQLAWLRLSGSSRAPSASCAPDGCCFPRERGRRSERARIAPHELSGTSFLRSRGPFVVGRAPVLTGAPVGLFLRARTRNYRRRLTLLFPPGCPRPLPPLRNRAVTLAGGVPQSAVRLDPRRLNIGNSIGASAGGAVIAAALGGVGQPRRRRLRRSRARARHPGASATIPVPTMALRVPPDRALGDLHPHRSRGHSNGFLTRAAERDGMRGQPDIGSRPGS